MASRDDILCGVDEPYAEDGASYRDFILQSIAAYRSMPVAYRGSVRIDVRNGGDAYFGVSYHRPETEWKRRARFQQSDRRASEAEARERAELARLKAKYEGK